LHNSAWLSSHSTFFVTKIQAATRIPVGTLTITKNKKLAELELGRASSLVAHSCVTKLKFVRLSCYILTKGKKKKKKINTKRINKIRWLNLSSALHFLCN
jgi:hypothetical protein